MSGIFPESRADLEDGPLIAIVSDGAETDEVEECPPLALILLEIATPLMIRGYPAGVAAGVVCSVACAVSPSVPLSVLSATMVCPISATTHLLGLGLAAVDGSAWVRSVARMPGQTSPTVSATQLQLHVHRGFPHLQVPLVLQLLLQGP
jgi:hypothetical protein